MYLEPVFGFIIFIYLLFSFNKDNYEPILVISILLIGILSYMYISRVLDNLID